ncbi:MAG: hypothetical protein HC850_18105 [Rhodomicrobium sp.]|nr:hypothetical protein [Rhodomicrobium sp.]
MLKGQGDMHLRLAAAKLKNRYNVEIETSSPKAAYRETIRGVADHHARHKKQSGGHGQFADIKVKIKPLKRGKASPSKRSSMAARCRVSSSRRSRPASRKGSNKGPSASPSSMSA